MFVRPHTVLRSGAVVCALLLCLLLPIDRSYGAEPAELRVGILSGPAPHYRFSFESGEITGFAYDVWTAVAQREQLKFRFVYFSSYEALALAVKENRVDVVPLLSVDDATKKVFDFTQVIHRSPVRIFSRLNNSEINAAEDLVGHRVSVVAGHAGGKLVQSYRGVLRITHDTVEEAVNALISRTSDALIYQDEVLWASARKEGVDSLLKVVDPPIKMLELAMGVRKGQAALLQQLRRGLKSYLGSDAFYNARAPWNGNPPPLIDPILVAKVLVTLLLSALAGLGLWRYVSVMRLNDALSESVADRQSAQERFKDLAESASDWFFEQDKDLRFTFVSPRFETVTGISPESLLGKTRWEGVLATSSAFDETSRLHAEALQERKDWQDYTYSITREDGERKIIRTSGKAIFDDQGNFTGYRGVGRDVTQRVELEQALLQAQKMEVVGQLTGGIAHDFNNLLTVMTGNLEILKKKLNGDERANQHLETTGEAVKLGTKLTQELLAFSRRQTLDPRSVDPNELVIDAINLVRSSLGPEISIVEDLEDGLAPVFADGTQLQNAILNLVINARDALPEGGAINIKTLRVLADADFVDTNPEAHEGDFAVVSVRDSGMGISEANLAKVIEPFFTTKEVGKGSGLGLSTVYGFANQSGGFLVIDSKEGQGTDVSIYLPIANPVEQQLTERKLVADPQRSMQAEGETVLVVDDDDRVREIAVIRLEELGYSVLEAGNAHEALASLDMHSNIDVLFTDIVMPGGMSGLDLADEVVRTRPAVKVLFATGFSEESAKLGEREHLGPLLRKPYNQSELGEKLRLVINA